MEALLLNSFVLRPLSRPIFHYGMHRRVSFHVKEMPLLFAKACHWNVAVIAQRWYLSRKLVRPSCVMRRRGNRPCRAKRNACIIIETCTRFVAPEIFLILSFHTADTTHTILRIILADDDESGIFDFNSASFTPSDTAQIDSHIFAVRSTRSNYT